MTRDLPKYVYRSRENSYMAVVKHKKQRHYLGSFPTPEEAHERALLFRKENPVQRGKKKLWQPGDEV